MAKQYNNQNGSSKKQPRLARKPFSLEGKKHIMGAYFNMAQSNFYKTLLEIFIKSDVKVNKNWSTNDILNQLEKVKDGKLLKNNDQKMRMQQLLFRHFPILGPVLANEKSYQPSKARKSNVRQTEDILFGVSLKECLEVISVMAKTLNDCRNYFTHFSPYNSTDSLKQQYENQKNVARYLDKAFVASRRINKERNMLTKDELEFLTGIDHYLKTEKKDDKGKIVTAYNKKYHKEMSVFIFMERENWYFRIFGERIIEETQEKRMALSDFGILYFCIIFLSKTYAKRLVEETGLLADSPFTDVENNVVREMMSIYRIRMTRGKKLDSNDTYTALAMDMLNELRKCPMPLYDVLSKEGQKFFSDEVNRDDGTLPETVKRFRNTDRFPYLVLRYIDAKKLFKDIRFQMELGKYRFKFYEKVGVDGMSRMRTLQKEINGFGRLEEIEAFRKERWADVIQKSELTDVLLEDNETVLQLRQFTEDTAESKPYVTDHKASYNITSNRIGMYWYSQPSDLMENGVYLPQLKGEDGNALVDMPCPKASLSVYDIPAMAFYQYLYVKNGCDKDKQLPSPEQIIKQTYNHLRDFFNDVKDGKINKFSKKEDLSEHLKAHYGVSLQWIPDKLEEYLLNEKKLSISKLFKEKSTAVLKERKNRLEVRLEKYIKDLETICSDDNKYAKKGYAEIRYSRLAKYIADSLMDWQPSVNDGSNKLTGQNFNVLVAFLATYHSGKPICELSELLKKAGLTEGQYRHPFIQDVLNLGPKNIEILYRRYLEKEIDYLEKCLEGSVNMKSIPFLHANRKKWQPKDERFFKELAGRYLEIEEGKDATILLPDGLFTPYILRLIKEKYKNYEALMLLLESNDEEGETNNVINNAAYLISRFFEIVRGDNGQPYYLTKKSKGEKTIFARTYDIFNILNNKKESNSLIPVYLSTDEINQKLTSKNNGEKCIEVDVENFLKKMTKSDRGNHKSLDDARSAMNSRLHRAIRFCKNNERAIRRFKTQDMVLFLLAQDLLQEIIPDNEQVDDRNFMLKKVCEDGFLSQAVKMEKDFEVDVDGANRKVKVVQDNMSLKNYGEFYRLINDERLISLLGQLGECGEIRYADLHSEFAIYDQDRSSVFKIIHDLEKMILDAYPELNQPDNETFNVDGKDVPKRNNFRALLGLLERTDENQLSDKEKELIISIRNAFGHNTYHVDLHDAAAEQKIELPKVADLILKMMENYYNRIVEQ